VPMVLKWPVRDRRLEWQPSKHGPDLFARFLEGRSEALAREPRDPGVPGSGER
jgi:hypothetical protein